jgi:hypothetical protein
VSFSQHLSALGVLALQGRPVTAVRKPWHFYALPLQMLAGGVAFPT